MELHPPCACNYQEQMRNLWDQDLHRLQLYCQPFERPSDTFKVSPQASCTGLDWIGLERYLTVIEETIPFRILAHSEYQTLLYQHLRGPSESININACVLHDYLNRRPNYFHWFLDALPRLFAAETYRSITGRPFGVVIPKSLRAWQQDSLMLVNSQAEEWIHVKTDAAIQNWSFDGLISSFSHRHIRHSPTGHFDAVSPRALEQLSTRLIHGMDAMGIAPVETGSSRLYVSRGDAQQRAVLNEESVMAYLSAYGFQCVRPDHLSLAEQIEVFRRATHIIAPHGGALTNLIYVSPGCQVLEIFQSGHGLRPDFFQLAALRGAFYSFWQAASVNKNNDIEIPLDLLRTFLEASL
ncbi:MAG: glycosyltransferase 61 family protein [Cyanobacteriota bacterium]|nr:glycosyltransferase 61 family protein [Cyanobacteriota bacterium]